MENQELSELRKEIDKIDYQLMPLLDQRAEIVKTMGELKKRYEIPIINGDREREILLKAEGFENKGYIYSVFSKIFEESRRIQEERI
jgi:chorismate mutase